MYNISLQKHIVFDKNRKAEKQVDGYERKVVLINIINIIPCLKIILDDLQIPHSLFMVHHLCT